jgi:DNA modification methylase
MFKIINGDCQTVISSLEENSIDLCLTSPPYANQRTGAQSTAAVLYSGIAETDFPEWVVGWMEVLKPKLRPAGSVLVVIRSHVRNGEISDYIMKTRLAVRANGWKECEELIWYKPDSPPLGSNIRPRRCFEQILWFSQTGKPYCDLYACGNKKSKRTGGFVGSERFGEGVIAAEGQIKKLKHGTSRVTDVFTAAVGSLPKGVMHPAMYPTNLTDNLIQTFSPKNGHILDPFCGSGQTGISSLKLGRFFTGIDISKEYCELALDRLKAKSHP